MRKWLPALFLLALVPSAGAAPVRAVVAPAPVLALAADGARIAYATGRSSGDCNRVFVWHLGTRGVTKLGRRTHCEATSTGNAIDALSLAGQRALWVHYVGGNTREWTLWTATTTRPRPLLLRRAVTDADAPPPFVIGEGDATAGLDILPYAFERTVVALRANGARRFTYEAGDHVVALAAGGGRLAVATRDGIVTVLDLDGNAVAGEVYSGSIDAVRLDGDRIVVQRGRTLELRGPGGRRTWELPRNARLGDARQAAAYYTHVGQIVELSLDADNRRRNVGSGSHVQVEGTRLAIASGRRVSLTTLR